MSRLKVSVKVKLGALLCRVQQQAKSQHYQCKLFVCVSVISVLVQIMVQIRSMSIFYGSTNMLIAILQHKHVNANYDDMANRHPS